MEHRSTFEQQEAASLDPHDYIRAADIALVAGDRRRAAMLIAEAYLAFDLFATDCDDFTDPDMAWPERSS